MEARQLRPSASPALVRVAESYAPCASREGEARARASPIIQFINTCLKPCTKYK